MLENERNLVSKYIYNEGRADTQSHEYCSVLDLNLNEFISLFAGALSSLDIYSASLCREYFISCLTLMATVSKEKLPNLCLEVHFLYHPWLQCLTSVPTFEVTNVS